MSRVVATQKGYYGGVIREEGASFTLRDEKDFSKNWMEADGWTPKGQEKQAAKAADPKPDGDTATKDPGDEKPKKTAGFKKKFTYQDGRVEVDGDQAWEAAYTTWCKEGGKTIADWNALPDATRKDLIEKAAERLSSPAA